MTKDSLPLRLVSLSNPKEIRECHEQNYNQWGQGLTLDQYLQREQVFASQPSCRNGGLTYWAFQELGDQGWTTVCAMESLNRPALYKIKGEALVDNTLSHSIGAVYTPESNRGKGYATKMLNWGVDNLDSWQMETLSVDKSKTFSVLWSDIGAYYEKFGYYKTTSWELKFKTVPSLQPSWPQGVEPIKYEDIEALAQQDVEQVKFIMDRDTELDGIPRVAIRPDAALHYTTLQRAIYLSQFMSNRDKPPSVFGAKHGSCWMLWTQDFSGNKLTSLRLYADVNASKSDVVADCQLILQAALCEAHKWNFPTFTVWAQDIPEQLTPDDLKAVQLQGSAVPDYVEREDSWPMVRSYQNSTQNFKWVFSGKYGWF